MRNGIFKVLAILGLLILPLAATACNTTEGIGKDTEKAGEKIQDAADRNK